MLYIDSPRKEEIGQFLKIKYLPTDFLAGFKCVFDPELAQTGFLRLFNCVFGPEFAQNLENAEYMQNT